MEVIPKLDVRLKRREVKITPQILLMEKEGIETLIQGMGMRIRMEVKQRGKGMNETPILQRNKK